MDEKSVLLIIGGGVAAYKSLELIRELGRQGVATRCVLTKAGAQFVTPLSVSALCGEKVFQDMFDLTDESEMGHIELSRSTDLVVVCPATADLMAKAANGLANDLASTALLATDKPVMMVPTMNVRMWDHKATQRNIAQLRADGVFVMEPDVGPMACGEFGPGRLPTVERITADILGLLHNAADGPLKGRSAIVTAGPTREPLDPVRYISNHSSGKQGYAIAYALSRLGADVTLVSGPTALDAPKGVDFVPVETAEDMLNARQQGVARRCVRIRRRGGRLAPGASRQQKDQGQSRRRQIGRDRIGRKPGHSQNRRRQTSQAPEPRGRLCGRDQ